MKKWVVAVCLFVTVITGAGFTFGSDFQSGGAYISYDSSDGAGPLENW